MTAAIIATDGPRHSEDGLEETGRRVCSESNGPSDALAAPGGRPFSMRVGAAHRGDGGGALPAHHPHRVRKSRGAVLPLADWIRSVTWRLSDRTSSAVENECVVRPAVEEPRLHVEVLRKRGAAGKTTIDPEGGKKCRKSKFGRNDQTDSLCLMNNISDGRNWSPGASRHWVGQWTQRRSQRIQGFYYRGKKKINFNIASVGCIKPMWRDFTDLHFFFFRSSNSIT